ncbi:MAG: metallophosphoesterase family protein [Candidatus Methylomirabilales bacterium]
MIRVAGFFFVIAVVGLEVTILWGAWIGLTAAPAERLPLLGNRPENIAILPDPEAHDPYTFAVIGDTKGNQEIAEWLFEKGQDTKPAFVLHLGDFVEDPGEWEYRYVVPEFQEIRHVPVFVVPGNHDLDMKGSKEGQWFDRVLGPRQIHFIYRNDLFIIADDVTQSIGDLVRWLDEVLQREAGGRRYIFLAMHIPIFDIKNDQFLVERSHPIHQLAKKWGISYAFFGNYHSFLSMEVDGVKYVVSGGGGSRLYGKAGFYHTMVFDVSDAGIQSVLHVSHYAVSVRDALDRVVTYVNSLEDIFEWLVIADFLPFGYAHPYLTLMLFITIQASIIGCGIGIGRKGRRPRATGI